jgi:hypothetical protein
MNHPAQAAIAAALIALASFATAPAWAVNKCTGADGKVQFQDAPCMGKGEVLVVKPASGRGPGAVASASVEPVAAAAPPVAAAPPARPAPAGPPPKSAMDLEADMCLAWYRPLLRDPVGAYYTNTAKSKRVFSMDLHATNGYGGYVIKRASCEIHNGKLNDAWTKNHAREGGWGVN